MDDLRLAGRAVLVEDHVLVRGLQPAEHLDADGRRERRRGQYVVHRAQRREVRERDALDPLHHDEEPRRVLAEVVDLHDVRMVHGGRETGLLHEHRAVLFRVHQVPQDALDGHGTAEALGALKVGAPHLRHAALPREVDQTIATADERAGRVEAPFHPDQCTRCLSRGTTSRAAVASAKARAITARGARERPTRPQRDATAPSTHE